MKIPGKPRPMQAAQAAPQQPTIPPAYLAMAAAHMQGLGKLSMPGSQPTQPLAAPDASNN